LDDNKTIGEIKQEYRKIIRQVKKSSKCYKFNHYIKRINSNEYIITISTEELRIEDFTEKLVRSFLIWLEENRGSDIATRNQRLSALKAFFRYAGVEDIKSILECQKISNISYARQVKGTMNYLSVYEVRQLLRAVDLSARQGRRNLCFLYVLYDTGTRISEVLTLKVHHIYLDPPAKVVLFGKGRKYREVPLMHNTVEHLRVYLESNQLDTPDKLDEILFRNQQGTPLTRAGTAYILKKYADLVGIESPISPHVLRHSKAMHLLEANVNIFYIKDFLGHVDISTTEIYARTSIETQRAILEKHDTFLPATTPSWATDENTLEWLKSLGKKK